MKKKIIISALALTIGAGLAGSITSTAAWYQYSTKVNAAYVGASGGAIGNLNIRLRKSGYNWTTFISKETIESYLTGEGYATNLQPVTPGALTANGALASDSEGLIMYSNPIPGNGPYSTWKRASKANYVVIPLQLRYITNGNAGNDPENIYLSDLVLDQRTTDPATGDITDALRFHISTSAKNYLISKAGGEIATNGKLDLDGDGSPDKAKPDSTDKYGFNSNYTSTQEITYGEGTQTSLAASNVVATPRQGANGDDLVDTSVSNDKLIGAASSTTFLDVDITIWVEGWQPLESSALWSSSYINAAFNIGFEFATNPEVDA